MSSIALYFFENEKLNKYNPLWILILIMTYILIIYTTVYWYFFPHPYLHLIFEEAASTAWILQILIILYALSLIRGFITVRKEYHEERFKKVPIPLVVMSSIIIPLIAFVNIFTGNFLLSMGLLVYGIIYTVAAFKFR